MSLSNVNALWVQFTAPPSASWPSPRAFYGNAVVGNNSCGVKNNIGEFALVFGGLNESSAQVDADMLSENTFYAGVNYSSLTDMWVFSFTDNQWRICQQGVLANSQSPSSNFAGAGRVLPVSGTLGDVFTDSTSASQSVFVVFGGMIVGGPTSRTRWCVVPCSPFCVMSIFSIVS
jgi:hypothetical protein